VCPANQERLCNDDRAGTTHRPSSNAAAQPAGDVKSLHAKIGELTLENDFLGLF
jgi:hypothetical protein